MKKIISIIFVLFAFLTSARSAEATDSVAPKQDAITISLLTCTSGDQIWSEYGHTALRVNGLQGKDVVFNYGTFDFSKSFFILRFIFGLTDYKCAAMPFEYFMMEFATKGMGVTEQLLNLTEEEKEAIVRALIINVQPENQVYRYNFFYDNCATRPRDIVLDNIAAEGKERSISLGKNSTLHTSHFTLHTSHSTPQTYRSLIHARNGQSLWNRYGEDLLLGIGADRAVTQEEAEFLPDILMDDFDRTVINGKPLVSKKQELLAPTLKLEKTGWFTPTVMSCLLLAVCLLALLWECRRKRVLRWLDLLLLLAAGLVGAILTMMIFSQHPTVRVNLLLLIFNPLPFVMFCVTLYNMVRARGRISRRWWMAWWVLILLGAIGGIFQQYPEGMLILALSLLLRCTSNLLLVKENKA